MATIRAKLKQLRDADVRFISLVDRAASRIPFRVLKRDKETAMGIDLTRVFKSDDAAKKPFVSAVVVLAHPDEAVTTAIREVVQKAGFATDRVQKSDEGQTMVYAQGDQPKDVQVVRLGEHALASVANLVVPQGWMGDLVEEYGFFPDLKMATSALHQQITEVAKSETPQADAHKVLESFGQYLDQMFVLPAAAFGLEASVAEIVKKAAPKKDKEENAEEASEDPKEEASETPEEEAAEDDEADEPTDDKKKTKKEEIVEKADDKKPEPTTNPPGKTDDKVRTPDKPGPAAPGTPTKKSDNAILQALKGIEERTVAQFTSLSQKVEAIGSEQASQKKILDEVVQKADTLSTTLKTTVTASPSPEDRPAGTRMRTQKADDDPRTGNFDTAFLRRRR